MPEQVSVDWVDEIPERKRVTPYDSIIEKVLKEGKIARIEATKETAGKIVQTLRSRVVAAGLQAVQRTTTEGTFVFIGPKEEN